MPFTDGTPAEGQVFRFTAKCVRADGTFLPGTLALADYQITGNLETKCIIQIIGDASEFAMVKAARWKPGEIQLLESIVPMSEWEPPVSPEDDEPVEMVFMEFLNRVHEGGRFYEAGDQALADRQDAHRLGRFVRVDEQLFIRPSQYREASGRLHDMTIDDLKAFIEEDEKKRPAAPAPAVSPVKETATRSPRENAMLPAAGQSRPVRPETAEEAGQT